VGKLKILLAPLLALWNPARDTWLVRFCIVGIVAVVGAMGAASYWVLQPAHGLFGRAATLAVGNKGHEGAHGREVAGHAEGGGHGEHGAAHGEGHGEGHGEAHAEGHESGHGEEEGEEEEEHGGGHEEGGAHGGEHGGGEHGGEHAEGGGESAGLGHNPIPKSIRARRTGTLAADHDLVDPDIQATRSLASMMKGEVEVSTGARFVEIPDVMASTKLGGVHNGKIFISPHLEVTTREAQAEVESRKTEIQSLISSIVSERQRDTLKTFEGQARLKLEIQREINHLLRNGQVTDVLFANFYVM
jgi:hypothetical protein